MTNDNKWRNHWKNYTDLTKIEMIWIMIMFLYNFYIPYLEVFMTTKTIFNWYEIQEKSNTEVIQILKKYIIIYNL